MKKLLSFILFLAVGLVVQSQVVLLNPVNNTHKITTCSGYFYDDGGATNNYSNGYDYWVALCPTDSSLNMTSLHFESADIHISDTMFFYSGVGINPLKSIPHDISQVPTVSGYPYNASMLLDKDVESPVNNTSGCITVRFKSSTINNGKGWKASISCISRCQRVLSGIDTTFIRYDSVTSDAVIRPVRYFIDTVIDSSGVSYNPFYAIDICRGDSITLKASPLFPDNDINYHQSDSSCVFYWDFGDGEKDTSYYDPYISHKWSKAIGYNMTLMVVDTLNGGCHSKNSLPLRVRTAINPIKTVAPLPDICSGSLLTLNVGYSSNSAVTVDTIDFSNTEVERLDSTVFIPDGPVCGGGTLVPYYSPVTFTKFPSGAVVSSANDIKSLCINMEHSYLGDIGIRVICPNGQSTVLKWNTHNYENQLGISIDNVTAGCDASTMIGTHCCSINTNGNANCDCTPGTGWTYCFSNQHLNGARGVISSLSPLDANGFTIDSTHVNDTTGYFQTPQQTGITVTPSGCTGGCETTDLNGFSNLIGCPLNGEWNLEIYDNFASDNGFVFAWWLELGQDAAINWSYQVPIDTVIWDGPFTTINTSTAMVIAPPIDSCGSYRYDIHIVDDFACVWDTNTHLNIKCTPIIDLGHDTALCNNASMVIDGGNPSMTHIWNTGDTTRYITITSASYLDTSLYVVQETNDGCIGIDSIAVKNYKPVYAGFVSNTVPLEGCEPFNFELRCISDNVRLYEWTVGGRRYYGERVNTTMPYGSYDIILKVISPDGCRDSVRYNDMITVYKSPKAEFSWSPSYITKKNPVAKMINLTTPDDITNRYHWKFQKYKDLRLIENVFDKEPTYKWMGADIVGDYSISLDAYSVNNAPSGFVYECHDTITKSITIINDSLIFPNVLTPNGDGINDVFIIKNLIDGQAYPDNKIYIYNRLGKKVFYAEDVRCDEELWNPKNETAGTYFYHFEGVGVVGKVEYNGIIEVIK